VTDTTDVTHHPERSRFESGKAYLSYVRDGDTFDLQHTIVPRELEGQGVGGALVRAAIGYARDEGLQLNVTCPFAKSWLEKHPDA
jgi:predicted GNAT family acetyltransferase